MSDPKKQEKLTAAKKLLKSYQQKNKKHKDTNENSGDNLVEAKPVEESAVVYSSPSPTIATPEDVSVALDTRRQSYASSKESITTASSLFNNFENNSNNSDNPALFFDQLAPNPAPSINGHSFNSTSERTDPMPNMAYSASAAYSIPDNSNVLKTASSIPDGHQYLALYSESTEKMKWYENELALKSASEHRLREDVDALQEKIQLQMKSIEIILSEKLEFQSQCDTIMEELKSKRASCEELTNRLKASRNHVGRLEKELTDLQEARSQHNSILKRLESSLQDQKTTADTCRQELDIAKQEISEMKRCLEISSEEKLGLENIIKEKESQLSLALIKIQQLGSDEGMEGVLTESSAKDQNVDVLNQKIAFLERENQQNSLQYQEYISGLNAQLQELASKYESVGMEKEELGGRVQSLVEHIQELEKQIQRQSVEQTPPPPSDTIARLEEASLTIASLQQHLHLKCEELEVARKRADFAEAAAAELEERFTQLSGEVPDARLLQAAIESDRVAATRAIAQNNQLKQQLTELQQAYIKLQDNKLDLTEQLDKEMHQSAELRDELAGYIKKEVSRANSAAAERITVDGCCQTTYHDLESVKSGEPMTVTPEAAAMLEDKFRSTMNKLAEMEEEKQRLEHLVLQLQGETDTIGEYIALYQTQRCKLEQKAIENQRTVAAIAKEKEDLRAKLAEISALVPTLIKEPQVTVGEEAVERTEAEPEASQADAPVDTLAATKIMNLLSEIGTSSLVTESAAVPEVPRYAFHPCSLCSGRLLTV